jgi:organic radical activating enzyme|tara:strand:- start:288 stop:1538 length:1251 start_codon:yes stop_codon:yes gene_type:complete
MDIKLKCKYAWSHLDFLQGEYAPCYRFKIKPQPIASLKDSLPSDVINNASMQAVRASLQQGVFPPGCSDCAYKESHGLKSYRQKSLNDYEWDVNSIIDYNKTTVANILDLELKFSRTCNFLCRHCMSDSNSQFETLGRANPEIAQQLLDLGFDHIGVGDSPITTVSAEIIDDLIQNIIPGVERINFSGGEPLYHLAHYKFLERLINDVNIDTKQIQLSYNTNLSLIDFKSYNISDLWQHFKSVHLTVSLDGTGELFNYFRERGDWDTVIANMYTLLERSKNIDSLLLVCTCTSYHAFYADVIFDTLSKLIKDIKQKFNIGWVTTHPTFVHYPAGLDMVNLPNDTKNKLINKFAKTVGNSTDTTYNDALYELLIYLHGDASADTTLFAKIVKLQDQLHNRSCKGILPELAAFVYADE